MACDFQGATLGLANQQYLISWMQYDPALELARLDAPVLIVQGTTDNQVSVADAEVLSAARGDAELLIIDGMNHVFKAASLEPAAQQAAYTDPALPIVPELAEALLRLARSLPAGPGSSH